MTDKAVALDLGSLDESRVPSYIVKIQQIQHREAEAVAAILDEAVEDSALSLGDYLALYAYTSGNFGMGGPVDAE